jgi:hypothetical protein
VVLRAAADGDVDVRDNAAVVSPVVVGVGDSDVRAWGRRGFAGRAVRGRGPGLKRSLLRLSRVDVAVVRHRKGRCAWLTARRGGFVSRRPSSAGGCGTPRWLRTRGTGRWSLRLARPLPAGRYTVYSRASIRAGFPEARFTARDRNRVDFRLR